MEQRHRYIWVQWLRKFCQRHAIPLLLGIVVTIAVLVEWQQLVAHEQVHLQQLVQQEAKAIESELNQELSNRILALEQMAHRWQASGGIPRAIWEADAADHVEHTYGYQAIEWVDPSCHVRWVVPLQGNEAVQNFNLCREPHHQIALNIARDLRQTILTRSVSLPQGGKGFLAIVPLFVKDPANAQTADRFDGYIVGVFRFQSLFDTILENSPRHQLQAYDRHNLIYSQGAIPNSIHQTVFIRAYGANWQVQVFPTSQLISDGQSLSPTVVLWSGLAGAWILALLVDLGQHSARQAQRTQKINRQLQDEILQRQQIESRLRVSEERWQLAIRGNNDGVWDWDVKANKVFFSSRWKEMLGFDDSEVSNQLDEWSKRVHPDDLAWVTQKIQTHFDKATPFYISEHRIQCKDGSYRWILDRGQAVRDEAGDVVRMVSSHTDITERKQIEIALQESEGKYRNLVEHLNAGFVVHAPDARILQCNAKACELLGLSMAQMLGKATIDPAWHFICEDGTIMPVEEYPVNQVLFTQKPLEKSVLGIHRGSLPQAWVLVTAFPEFDTEHQLTQVVVTFIDISKLKQIETELRETAEVTENVISGISRLDAQGRYLYVNKAYADISGYQPEDLIGLSWQQTVHPHDLEHLTVAHERMVQTGRAEIEVKGIRKDGSSFYKQLVMLSIYNEQQQFSGHYCFMKDISDRKQTELALKLSEERLKLALEASGDGLWDWNVETGEIYLSPHYQEMLGYQPGELVMDLHVWVQMIHPEDKLWVIDRFNAHLQDRSVQYAFDYRVRCKSGAWKWIANYGKVVAYDLQGKPVRMIGAHRDITERKQAEWALEQELMRSQTLFNTSIDGVVVLNHQGNVTQTSPSFAQMLGYTLEETLQLSVFDWDAQWTREELQQILENGTVSPVFETRHRCKDGSIYDVEISYSRVELNDEIMHFCICRNITERKQAEIALNHQKNMLEAIFNHIPMMIALFNAEGRIELVNPSFEHVLGWSLEDWRQRDMLLECYPNPAYRQTVIEHMLAANSSWKDFTTLTKTGQQIATSWINVKLSNGSNLGIGQDITDRKHKEIALRQAMEAAEAANLAKSMFLANMSHELRTPLNVILGFAQVMTHDPSLTPHQKEDLQTIRRSGDHLLSLINDVLDLSKIEAGHCTLEETGFDLISLLHTLRTMMTERAKAKHLQVEFEITPEIPQFVVADEQKLRQILLNLLSNAIKFTKQGQIKLSVSALNCQVPLAICPQMMLQFQISDTGVGIAPEDIHTIFDAFMQAEAGRKSIGGTGLGLTISHKLLKLMGGAIAVNSTLRQGTQFTFTLPIHATSGVDIQPEQQERTVIGLMPDQPHCRILVVDDQRENRQLLVRFLSPIGVEVREAGNGQEAIRIWQDWQPHLTWMDIRMPILDGYEATKWIRDFERARRCATPPACPTPQRFNSSEPSIIIALTAQASQSDRALALAAGCNDYISKPFREETIFLKMREYLGLEYLYAEAHSSTEAQFFLPQDGSLDCYAPISVVLPDRASLPLAWLDELEEATVCGDDWKIVKLAAQLSPELAQFSARLTEAANHYQFEQILRLIRGDSLA